MIPEVLLAIFLAAGSIQPQQLAGESSQIDESNVRPCVVVSGVYVAGNVVNPRAVYPKQPLTLTQAIKLAGGVRSDARTNKVLFRQKDGAMVSVTVDLNEIGKHRTKDPILEPYDIVDVGGRGQPMPRLSYPTPDSRPLIPPGYRVIY